METRKKPVLTEYRLLVLELLEWLVKGIGRKAQMWVIF
jgi:hypothetical protein